MRNARPRDSVSGRRHPPPDFVIHESTACARYLIDRGADLKTLYGYVQQMLQISYLCQYHVPYLCEQQMTMECVTQLGRFGCYLFMTRTPPSDGAAAAVAHVSDDSHISKTVSSGRELAAALADPRVTSAQLQGDVALSESDFEGLPSPIVFNRDYTISGGESEPPSSWPELSFGFVEDKIRLEGGAVLTIEHVVLRDFRATPLDLSPGLDLLASSSSDAAGDLVRIKDAVMMLRICVPKSIQGEIKSSIPRPDRFPGTQLVSTPQPSNCTDDPSAPATERCWPDQGVYDDVAVDGFDVDSFERASATRYALSMLRVPYLCQRQMTDECVSALGPLGCFLYIPGPGPLHGAHPLLPSSPPYLPPAPPGGAARKVASGLELAAALADGRVTSAQLKGDVALSESDFEGLPSPIVLDRTFTISGGDAESPSSWPELSLGPVKGKVRLEGGAVLTIEHVVLRDFRANPLGQSPGLDLLASSSSDAAGDLVRIQDAVMMLRICIPKPIQGEIMSIPRPDGFPGTQLVSFPPPPNCTDDPSAPATERCWPDQGVYDDVAEAGFDMVAYGSLEVTATRYALSMLHVPYLCQQQMTEECVWLCWVRWDATSTPIRATYTQRRRLCAAPRGPAALSSIDVADEEHRALPGIAWGLSYSEPGQEGLVHGSPAPQSTARGVLPEAYRSVDAILMLAGGQTGPDSVPPWAERRLDTCLSLQDAQRKTTPILLLGGGTPHKGPYLDSRGFVIHESTACARYLIDRGADPKTLLKETSSYDTVGNAYFSLTIHALPAGWRRLAVVTSDFHMARTAALYQVMYSLAGRDLFGDPRRYELLYVAATDGGLFEPDVLAARKAKEAEARATWLRDASRMRALPDLHDWFHQTHLCYAVQRQHEFGVQTIRDPKLLASY
ncbi:hypothetical protein HYH03_015893 [Edaphochlamys debaryana]|uniref:DUF218 domain-containing protein n=1 Tax=Edaphochlamys debaryana TaxID=47281 RepID=A0A835XLE5_9CHLO|nr:hypothetical protein HYH03_015893 [Edaphochlamys debaryana]|eukprot:KAG2485407.1 hypothetical protein HYH03_015893 [Edaphochlamys debaryana]